MSYWHTFSLYNSPNASEYDQSNEKNEMEPSKTEQRNGISNIQSNPGINQSHAFFKVYKQ